MSVQMLSHEWTLPESKGGDAKTLVLLHGLLGNRKNIRSFSKALVRAHPQWRVLLCDLRGHGGTPALNTPGAGAGGCSMAAAATTLALAAEDVAFTCDALGLSPPEAVVGHSCGGKVALAYLDACRHPSGAFGGRYFPFHDASALAPDVTWALDTVPSAAAAGDPVRAAKLSSVAYVLDAVESLPPKLPSKAEALRLLVAQGLPDPVAQWICTSLAPAALDPSGGGGGDGSGGGGGSGGEWAFVYDVGVCRALFASYAATDLLPTIAATAAGDEWAPASASGEPCTVDIVVAGLNPGAWPPPVREALDEAAAAGPGAAVHVLPAAGHNVHMDDPRGLLALMGPSLER